jgi:hypothetical protein
VGVVGGGPVKLLDDGLNHGDGHGSFVAVESEKDSLKLLGVKVDARVWLDVVKGDKGQGCKSFVLGDGIGAGLEQDAGHGERGADNAAVFKGMEGGVEGGNKAGFGAKAVEGAAVAGRGGDFAPPCVFDLLVDAVEVVSQKVRTELLSDVLSKQSHSTELCSSKLGRGAVLLDAQGKAALGAELFNDVSGEGGFAQPRVSLIEEGSVGTDSLDGKASGLGSGLVDGEKRRGVGVFGARWRGL